MLHHLSMSSAASLLAMGGYAYFKKRSIGSLAGSTFLSAFFLSSAFLTQHSDKVFLGCCVGALGGGASTAIGIMRYKAVRNTGGKSFIPIFLICLGITNLAYYAYKANEWKYN